MINANDISPLWAESLAAPQRPTASVFHYLKPSNTSGGDAPSSWSLQKERSLLSMTEAKYEQEMQRCYNLCGFQDYLLQSHTLGALAKMPACTSSGHS